ncbi:hypothetical protein QR77_33935 [Streptomyces sp. 150FB]|uniref:DUF397 domain-containing protein n=1 Tax=Streptomyces sp. 150FB TaxID=1576605 RepID=UPI0005890AFD|nr:DUF397 domain-containing protein [Streptomyces sp. 150FB]KIF77502.1 hypothetical protein QR77_33935 [Streptomyces sp. 150FB]
MTCIPNASAAVGVTWTKSSHSGNQSNCVEVAHGVANLMPVRDSKRPTGPAIVFPAGAWTAFVADLKADA